MPIRTFRSCAPISGLVHWVIEMKSWGLMLTIASLLLITGCVSKSVFLPPLDRRFVGDWKADQIVIETGHLADHFLFINGDGYLSHAMVLSEPESYDGEDPEPRVFVRSGKYVVEKVKDEIWIKSQMLQVSRLRAGDFDPENAEPSLLVFSLNDLGQDHLVITLKHDVESIRFTRSKSMSLSRLIHECLSTPP